MSPTSAPVHERELLAQVVQASADAIYCEDLSGSVTTWNRAAERLYGCRAEQMLGRSAGDLAPVESAGLLADVRGRALAGERVERLDTWHVRPDGRHVAVSLTVSPLRSADGAVVALATSVQDVDDRVRLAADLEDAHRTLARQHEALQRSNRDLEQFAYVASHDLSEPLRVMTGYVQLLESRYGEVLDERGRRYVQHVVEGSARMRTLIEDLLTYARYLRTDSAPGRVDVLGLARREAADLSQAQVRIEELPEVWGDAGSVQALLHNLMGNAVKFARPGVPSVVHVAGTVVAGRVHLTVDDNGIGIDPEYRERVFRMFQRLHVREAYPGTGIGLAIVQQVAEGHGGRAWVEDSPLGGSRFCVTLPPAPAPAPARAPAPRAQLAP